MHGPVADSQTTALQLIVALIREGGVRAAINTWPTIKPRDGYKLALETRIVDALARRL